MAVPLVPGTSRHVHDSLRSLAIEKPVPATPLLLVAPNKGLFLVEEGGHGFAATGASFESGVGSKRFILDESSEGQAPVHGRTGACPWTDVGRLARGRTLRKASSLLLAWQRNDALPGSPTPFGVMERCLWLDV